jgi:hypothetical protein
MKELMVIPLITALLLGTANELIGLAEQASNKTVAYTGEMENALDCAFQARPLYECSPNLMNATFQDEARALIGGAWQSMTQDRQIYFKQPDALPLWIFIVFIILIFVLFDINATRRIWQNLHAVQDNIWKYKNEYLFGVNKIVDHSKFEISFSVTNIKNHRKATEYVFLKRWPSVIQTSWIISRKTGISFFVAKEAMSKIRAELEWQHMTKAKPILRHIKVEVPELLKPGRKRRKQKV